MLYLAYSVHDPAAGAIYVGFNPHHYAITVALPEAPPGGGGWRRVADTALPTPADLALKADAATALPGEYYEVAGKAAVVFAARPAPVLVAQMRRAAAVGPGGRAPPGAAVPQGPAS